MQELQLHAQTDATSARLLRQICDHLLNHEPASVSAAIERRLQLEAAEHGDGEIDLANVEDILEADDAKKLREEQHASLTKAEKKKAFLDELRGTIRPKASRPAEYWRAAEKRITVTEEEAKAQIPEGATIRRSPLQGRWCFGSDFRFLSWTM